MEVHAHTHTERKKWTHYLWEFLMLFFAVFCGFLAENFREHQVEKNKEREYIMSMIGDLKTDTANINSHTIYRNNRRMQMDSLSWLLRQPDYLNHTGMIYYYARWVLRNTYFYPSDRTMQQLKNAGGMRLITHKAAADAIMAYDAQVKLVQTQTYSLEAQDLDEFQNMMTLVFDGNVLDEMYGDSLISIPVGNPPLITNDNKLINSFITRLHFVKSLNRRNVYFENKLKLQAMTTIDILKKDYDLE